MESFRDKAPTDTILGYMTTPWFATPPEHLDEHLASIKALNEARSMFYSED